MKIKENKRYERQYSPTAIAAAIYKSIVLNTLVEVPPEALTWI
ncbi:hypothetical protein [Tolypothrix sp. NIES-4075]|nr:hypothetical protein [Tolypothrix sp. NIES-4075]